MFSIFLPRIRHKASSNNNTPTWPSVPHNADEDTVSDNIPWPIPEPSYRRRTSNDKNNSSGRGTSSHHHQALGATPPNWNITISNPIPRTTPNSLTGGGVGGGVGGNRRDERGDATEGGGGDFLSSSRSGRRNPIGVAESNSREWFEGGGREREEEGESQRSKRARRLYPPSPPPLSSAHAPTQTNNRSRNEAIQLARELGPPQVVRIDSGTFDEDEEGEGGEDQDKNEGVGEDDDPPSYAYAYTHPGPYDTPRPPQEQQNSSAPLRNAESFIQSPSPAPTQPSRSHEVQHHNGRQSRQSDATSRNQSEAETEFYYSASAGDEFESGDEGRTRSRSSSSSQSGGAGKQQPQGQQPSRHSMTKSKWGLKLQMQLRELQVHSASMGADTTIAGSGSAVDNTETGGSQPSSNLETSPAPIAVDTDVHSTKNTYHHHHHHHSNNYPQLKQLSPIAEQEYVSPRPSPHSIASLGWKVDPEANEKIGKTRNGGEELAEGDERARAVSGRGVSMGSSVNAAGNAAGTGLGVGGSRATSGAIDSFTKGPSPFITRHLNRTVSQTSSKSDSVTPHTTTNTPTHSQPTTPRMEGVVPSYVRHIGRGGGGVRGEPTSVNVNVQAPPGAIVATTPPVSTAHAASQSPASTLPKLPSVPTFSAIDLRFSMLGSVSPRDRTSRGRVDKLPVIDGSLEGYREEEEEEEYERQSLHAESFVTAGEVELEPMGSESGETLHRESVEGGGESFIQRRWERNEELEPGVGGALSSSPRTTTFRAKFESRWPFKSGSSTLTPAFWTFCLGFVFPVLWLVGGWHFTNAGEMPPRCTAWEWYFWNRGWRWNPRGWMRECFAKRGRVRESQDSGIRFGEGQRRKGARRSSSVRKGKVYPALPRWVAEKQSTDDGRMRLNDPKRTLRGIQFGYPFIARPPTSQHSYRSGSMSSRPMLMRILTAPNRVLDQLYGVQLREVRGRPESGRRMFDPWIQRCRYAFCYAMLLLAAGLCTASVYLIIVNTRNL